MSLRKTALQLSCALGALAMIAAAPAADVDGDNKVSQAEFAASSLAKFDAADTNLDGRLDSTERRMLKKNRKDAKVAKRFAKMDANGDGMVSQNEMRELETLRAEGKATRKRALLKRFDANGDGQLDNAEKTMAETELEGGKYASKRKRRAAKRRNARLDIDQDGFVTRAEYLAMSDRLFALMDVDTDGYLVKGEARNNRVLTRSRGR